MAISEQQPPPAPSHWPNRSLELDTVQTLIIQWRGGEGGRNGEEINKWLRSKTINCTINLSNLICKVLKPFNLPGLPPRNESCYQHCFEFNFAFSLIYSQKSLKAGCLQGNSLYRAARIANFKGILGFFVPSIIVVKAGLMQITM